MSENRVNFGVLGCSGVCRDRGMPGIVNAPHAHLYAIASRSRKKAEEFAEIFQPDKIYTDYDALLADSEVTAVYLPLPNSLHKYWALRAIEAGKHVLCEKPMALSASDAEEMFAAAEKKGVLLMEAYAYRQAPLVQRVKELLQQGTIGRVKYIESTHTNMVSDKSGIRFQKEGGGNFFDVACYNISLMSYLLEKEPCAVKTLIEFDKEHEVDTSSLIQLGYEDGITAACYSAMNCYPKGRFSVLGESGRIDVPCKFNSRGLTRLIVAKQGRGQNAEIVDEVCTEYTIWCEDNYMLEMEQFSRAIFTGESPMISKEESLRTARMMDMVIKSAEKLV